MIKTARRFKERFLDTGKLSDPLRQVHRRASDLAGVDTADDLLRIVMEELSGVYIPTLSTLRRLERDFRIRRDFNGANYNELADREGVSCRSIRRIVNK